MSDGTAIGWGIDTKKARLIFVCTDVCGKCHDGRLHHSYGVEGIQEWLENGKSLMCIAVGTLLCARLSR